MVGRSPEVSIVTRESKVEFSLCGANPSGPFQPGDFILVHEKDLISKMIRVGQRIRYPANYSYWNHVVLIVTQQGDTIEALAKGISSGNVSNYQDAEYYLVRVGASDEDAKEMVAFADNMLKEKYSFSIIASIFFTLLFNWKFVFGRVGSYICSGLVASALTRGTAIFNKPPEFMTPADLAIFYNVNPIRPINNA